MRKAGWLGPQAQKVVVIVGEDDPSAWTHGPNHGPDDLQRVAHVLEKETRMGDVELLALAKGWRLDVTLSHVKEIAFVIDLGLAQCSADLLFAALYSDSWDACRSRHGAGELAKAGPKVDHTFALQELSL